MDGGGGRADENCRQYLQYPQRLNYHKIQMINNKIKTYSVLFFISVIVVGGLFYAYSVFASPCFSENIFPGITIDIGWGNTPDNALWSSVAATPNSQVRLSDAGEDGCAGTKASFSVSDGSNKVIRTLTGNLSLGRQFTSDNKTKFQLYYDWTNDLPAGTGYRFSIPIGGGALRSSNVLNIGQTTQACQLSTVTTNPSIGIPFGTPVSINVVAQGQCQDWGVSVNIYETTNGQNRLTSPPLPEQKFSAGSNQLTFSWSPSSNPGASGKVYRADANLGSQTVSSNPFTIIGTGTGTCNNNGKCESPGETSFTCPSDCKSKPGETQKFLFELKNPLQANNLLELIDVLATWLFNLSIPIVVVMIVYAGVMFLTSRGDTTKVTKARQILLYAVVGFAIILIGKGFITLIESILNLGAGP